jgi:hypothetical protein
MSLEENVKKWVLFDNKIKEITNELKQLRSEKIKYNKCILDYISNNNLDNATIKINDGKLRFVNINYSQPLTYKYIYDCLNKYYRDDKKATEIIDYIKSHRDIKNIKEIKRYTVMD